MSQIPARTLEPRDAVVSVPREGKDQWHITAARLKLALKYGFGPSPWKDPNWSVEFDRYAIRHALNVGSPSLTDLSVTVFMNSRVTSADLKRATEWLRGPVRDELRSLHEGLRHCDGLADMSDELLRDVGGLLDRMRGAVEEQELGDDGRRLLRGFGLAKPFKWFAAWAPAHVPMIDRYVADALAKMESSRTSLTAEVLLARFRRLLLGHQTQLRELSEWLQHQLGMSLPDPIPTVRILDSLLWMDWWGYRYFSEWINPDENRISYALTRDGERELEKLYS